MGDAERGATSCACVFAARGLCISRRPLLRSRLFLLASSIVPAIMSAPESSFNGAVNHLPQPPGTEVKKRKRGATRLSCAECRRCVRLQRGTGVSRNISRCPQVEAPLRPRHPLRLLRQARLRCHLSRRCEPLRSLSPTHADACPTQARSPLARAIGESPSRPTVRCLPHHPPGQPDLCLRLPRTSTRKYWSCLTV